MGKRKNNSDGTTALAMILLGIIAMPIVGISLMKSENDTDKGVGLILTIVGIVIWLFAFVFK